MCSTITVMLLIVAVLLVWQIVLTGIKVWYGWYLTKCQKKERFEEGKAMYELGYTKGQQEKKQ